MIAQQISTLGTLFLTKNIDTGDKMLDATLVSTLGIISTACIVGCYKHWHFWYNLAVFYIYSMWRDPTDVAKPPYIHNLYKYESEDNFKKDTSISEMITMRDTILLIKYLIENRFPTNNYLMKSNSTELLPRSPVCDKVYPILISNDGSTIYFVTDLYKPNSLFGYLCFTSQTSHDHMWPYIKKLLSKLHNDDLLINNNNNNSIYRASPSRNNNNNRIAHILHNSTSKETDMLVKIGDIATNKTFDSLFYSQKGELIKLLDKFKSHTLYPAHIPIDNKLGILLYGPPGTGKTGTINAIANMVKRSIVVINFMEIRTCKELDMVLIPQDYSKYLYVFDEFDCILDAMTGSVYSTMETKKTDWGTMLMCAEGEERKEILNMIKTNATSRADAPIDMAYLLQKLDGLESAEGRLIIATTNHPDKINPALLRPGRFDLKLCLGLCTSQMVVEILGYYYQADVVTRNKIKQAAIPSNKFSPLELINMAIQAPSLDRLLKQIKGF